MSLFLHIVFLVSSGIVLYTYLGYPLYLYVRKVWRDCPIHKARITPSVSIVMAVRNEQNNLPRKLDALLKIRHFPNNWEIIIASDASTDNTNAILKERASRFLRPVFLSEHRGKAAALNAAISASSGEILVFVDARQAVTADSIRELIDNFADAHVGCVSGELIFKSDQKQQRDDQGLYWRIEKFVRKWESRTGSVVGATGAFYAVRRQLIPTLPEGTILDDVYIPMYVARAGYRIVFDSLAVVFDEPTRSIRQEFHRKVRTIAGNYQLLKLQPWLLTSQNPLRLEFVSHKLCRLFVPFALIAVLLTSALLPGAIFRIGFALQVVFYSLPFLAPFTRFRLSRTAFTFLLLNAAAATAFLQVVTGRKIAWGR